MRARQRRTHDAPVDDQFLAFIAQNMQVEVHRHRCYQIILSLDRPFQSIIAGQPLESVQCLVINQKVEHACQALASRALIYFIEPSGRHGKRLKAMLEDRDYLLLPDALKACATLAQQIDPLIGSPRSTNAEGALSITTTLLGKLIDAPGGSAEGPTQGREALDLCLENCLVAIENRLHERVALADLAAALNLSTDWARHVFVDRMGVSFSQYVLWRRLKRSITLIVHHQLSFTEAAVQSGFSDQAHFCRFFKRSFGVAATGLLKNSRFVQFIHPAPC